MPKSTSRSDTGLPVHEADDYRVRVEPSPAGGSWIVVTPPAPAPDFVMVAGEARRLARKLDAVTR